MYNHQNGFLVYENWRAENKAVIHKSNCSNKNQIDQMTIEEIKEGILPYINLLSILSLKNIFDKTDGRKKLSFGFFYLILTILKNMNFRYLIICIIFHLFYIYSSAQNIITNEYYTNGKLRRTIVYDKSINIISEQYYKKTNSKLIANIKYNAINSFERVQFYDDDGVKVLFDIDFEKGKYIDYNGQIELNFKGNFIFEGKQIGKHIVANYINNMRNGPILQYDSTITGRVKSNKVFAEYEYKVVNGRVYITHTTLHPTYDDVYSLHKGAYCNFKNDVLDKTSSIFRANGKKIIESNFNLGKCLFYNSFGSSGTTISKINCQNGIVNSKILLNGTIKEFLGNNIVWFYTLQNIGEIYANYNPSEGYGLKESVPM